MWLAPDDDLKRSHDSVPVTELRLEAGFTAEVLAPKVLNQVPKFEPGSLSLLLNAIAKCGTRAKLGYVMAGANTG